MAQIGSIFISPPLINTACAWASDFSQLQALYSSPFTGAVTTRTTTLDGYDETSACGVVFTDSGSSTSSLNSYGYSPFPLSTYIGWVKQILTSTPEALEHVPTRAKPFIISITASTADELEPMISLIQILRHSTPTMTSLIAIELNTSCPNVSPTSPSGYTPSSIHPLLTVLSKAHMQDRSLTIGLKLPPYTHRGQFDAMIDLLKEFSYPDKLGNAFAFLTCTNTLGHSLLFSNQLDQVLSMQLPKSKFDSDSSEGGLEFAVPTAIGGLAGDALHPLSLGNVHTFHRLLHDGNDSDKSGLRNIAIIGVGGVTTPAALARMRKAGASVVGAATLLGKEGVKAFEILS